MRDKHCLGVIGVIITVAGWMASNSAHFPAAYRMVAPQYVNSMQAFERMQEKGFVLKKGDRGFTEISEIIKRLVSKEPDLAVTEIRTLASGYTSLDLAEGKRLVDFLRLEVLSSRLPSQACEIGGLEEAIKERYLKVNVFLWGAVVFGLGILLSLISIFMKE
ncbi:MAG: hypothetical protein KKE57_08460 [Proteobacteria bacterium]|nr:hypothetical protein [Pseudomonadota bacterium]